MLNLGPHSHEGTHRGSKGEMRALSIAAKLSFNTNTDLKEIVADAEGNLGALYLPVVTQGTKYLVDLEKLLMGISQLYRSMTSSCIVSCTKQMSRKLDTEIWLHGSV